MRFYGLRDYIISNGEKVIDEKFSYYIYKVGNSDYSIRVAEDINYKYIVFLIGDRYICTMWVYDEKMIDEFEELCEKYNNIKEVMDYYLTKYNEKMVKEEKKKKKLDNFMLKGE